LRLLRRRVLGKLLQKQVQLALPLAHVRAGTHCKQKEQSVLWRPVFEGRQRKAVGKAHRCEGARWLPLGRRRLRTRCDAT
jgi:hypothetical protein